MTTVWDERREVYHAVLEFAFTHPVRWAEGKDKRAEVFARENLRQIDLGIITGKTKSICEFDRAHGNCVVICPTVGAAEHLRAKGCRAFSVEELTKLTKEKFRVMEPMLIFDDVGLRQTLEVVAKFKPTRFVHVGCQ